MRRRLLAGAQASKALFKPSETVISPKWSEPVTRALSNQRLKLTGAAILVLRDSTFLQAPRQISFARSASLTAVSIFMAAPYFQFTDPFGDARVEELKLLSWTAQHGELSFPSVPSGPWHDLLVSILWSESLTVFSFEWAKRAYSSEGNPDPDLASSSGIPGESPLERARVSARVRAVWDLYQMCPPAGLRLTHSGRVRVSELKQALRAGRIREQYGMLWDGRHLQTDLQIALLDASEMAPLSVGFLDMNGLKDINDSVGHEAGSLAVRAYFQAVATALSDQGEAYGVGGDEV